MSEKHVAVGGIDCGADRLFLISGPCVIEDEPLMMRAAERLKGFIRDPVELGLLGQDRL